MKKIESDYIDKYGDIKRNDVDRLLDIMNNLKLSNKDKDNLFINMKFIKSIKWNRISFTIYLLPKSTPRPRHNMLRNTFYVIGAKDNKDIFKKFICNLDYDMITTPCKFTCVSYLPIPSGMNKIEKILSELGLIRPIVKPDWDNLGKTYSDMIQGTLLFDDSLIIEGVSKKYYSFKPRIEIIIDYMDEHDSMFNTKKMRKKVE